MQGNTIIDQIEYDLQETDSEDFSRDHIEQMLDDGMISTEEAAFLQGYHENLNPE